MDESTGKTWNQASALGRLRAPLDRVPLAGKPDHEDDIPYEMLDAYGLLDFVCACMNLYGCGPELPVLCVLCASAFAVSERWRAMPASLERGRSQPCGLMGWGAARSGGRKSEVGVSAFAPVYRVIASRREAWREENKGAYPEPLEEDATAEGLGMTLQETGGWGGLVNDEASTQLGNYSGQPSMVARYEGWITKAYDGGKWLKSKRAGGTSFLVPDPRLTTLLLGREKEVLNALFRDGDVNGYGARALLVVTDFVPPIGWAEDDVRENAHAGKESYRELMEAVFKAEPRDEVEDWERGLVRLTPEARRLLTVGESGYGAWLESERERTSDEYMDARLVRSLSLVLRIAAIFAVLKHVRDHSCEVYCEKVEVDEGCMRDAILLEKWFVKEFERHSGSSGRADVLIWAGRTLDGLRKKQLQDRFSWSEAGRHGADVITKDPEKERAGSGVSVEVGQH